MEQQRRDNNLIEACLEASKDPYIIFDKDNNIIEAIGDFKELIVQNHNTYQVSAQILERLKTFVDGSLGRDVIKGVNIFSKQYDVKLFRSFLDQSLDITIVFFRFLEGEQKIDIQKKIKADDPFVLKIDQHSKILSHNDAFKDQFFFDGIPLVYLTDYMPFADRSYFETCLRQLTEEPIGKATCEIKMRIDVDNYLLLTTWALYKKEDHILCKGQSTYFTIKSISQSSIQLSLQEQNAQVVVWKWEMGSNGKPVFIFNDEVNNVFDYIIDNRVDYNDWNTLVHPEDKIRVFNTMYSFIHRHTDIYYQQYRIKKNTKDYAWVMVSCVRTSSDKEGRVQTVRGVLMSIEHLQDQIYLSQREQNTVLQNVFDPVVVVDLNGLVIFSNLAAQKRLGHNHESLITMYYKDFFKDVPLQDLYKSLQNGHKEEEWKVLRYDKTQVSMNVHASIMRSADHKDVGIVLVMKDLTEVKYYQKAIKSSSERLENLILNLDVIFFEYDLKKHVFNFISPKIQELSGYVLNRWLTEPNFWETFVHPDDLRKVLLTGEPKHGDKHNYDYRMLRADGSSIWVHSNIVVNVRDDKVFFQGVITNINDQKLVENKLVASEKRFKILTENQKDIIFLLGKKHEYIYFSPYIETITGHTPEEALQLSNKDLFTAESAQKLFDLIAQRRDQEKIDPNFSQPIRAELELKHKDGRIIPVVIISDRIYDDEGNFEGYAGSLRDISERVKHTREIQKLVTAINHTNNGIVITNRIGEIEWSNNAYEEITGYTKEELLGNNPGMLLKGPNTSRKSIKKVINAYKALEPFKVDLLSYNKSGDTYWTSLAGEPVTIDEEIKYIVIESDISEIVKNQQELKSISDRFRLATQAAELGVWEWGLIDCDLLWTRLTVRGEEEIFDGAIEDFYPYLSKVSKVMLKSILKDAEKGILHRDFTFSITLSDAKVHTIKGNFLLSYDKTGRPEKLFGMTADITREKEKEIQNQRFIKDLKLRNKAQEELTQVISHNLRAPLANIIAISNLLEGDVSDLNIFVNGLKDSTNKLDGVIRDLNDILTLTNKDLVKSTFSMTDLIDQVVKELHEDFDTKINLKEKIYVDSLYTSMSHMQSIVYNLISNAIKFAKPNTKPSIAISTFVKGGKLILTVQDKGIGINLKKFKNKLFKMYQRLNSQQEGKGLGLYLIKTQTEELGGSIKVDSKEEEGTTFTIRLPKDVIHIDM